MTFLTFILFLIILILIGEFMNPIIRKIKDITISLVPLILYVLLLQLILFLVNKTYVNVNLLVKFIIGSIMLFFALILLLIGLDISVIEIGKDTGHALTKNKKIYPILIITFMTGLIIAIAEPDLIVLALQISGYSNNLISMYMLVFAIGIGVGITMLIAVLRTLFKFRTDYLLTILYAIILILSVILIILNPDFFSVSLDISASVTGAIVVPFILAFGIGISRSLKEESEENSFGMVGITASGTIIGALIYFLIISSKKIPPVSENFTPNTEIIKHFLSESPKQLLTSFVSIAPFFILFIIMQFASLKLPKKRFINTLKGFLYVFIGLFLFLLSVNVGYFDFAKNLGLNIYKLGITPLLFISLFLGLVVILSESSLHVLTKQINEVTNGALKKLPVIISISSGVGIALLLSTLRTIILPLKLEYIIIPLFIVSIILLYFTHDLFKGLSFDSGAVASGPLAATFILSFIQGVSMSVGHKPTIADMFGTLSLITILPIISLEILGIIYKLKTRKKGVVQNEKK